jgi:hypothetical protein
MKTFTTLALVAGMTAAFAGASFAQSSMSSMSSADKAQMTKCQGMSKSAMQADSQCTALMKKYPSATTGSSSGMNGSTTTSPSKSGGMTPSSPSK